MAGEHAVMTTLAADEGKNRRNMRVHMPEKIQAVIFDQDGLMFDTETLAARAWFEVGPRYGIHADHEFLRGVRGCKPDRTKQACMERYGDLPLYDQFREEKRQYSYHWIKEHGVPVKKGLRELLEYLRDHGVKTAVATACCGSLLDVIRLFEDGVLTLETSAGGID